MRRLGYFVTESSEHNAEYSAYFMPHGQRGDRQVLHSYRRVSAPLRRYRG
jgi:hypothetical protein